MSLTTMAKGIIYHINRYNVSETKKKCILKLCEKQIPKAIQKNIYNSDICPVCEEKVKTDDKYCRNCGQHIIIEIKDENKLLMDLIDDNTMGNFKANSSIGHVEIFIKWGFIRVSNKIGSWRFSINDTTIFYEQDNDILLTINKENLKGIVVYKPLEKVEINPNEIVSFEDWKQVRTFNPDLK